MSGFNVSRAIRKPRSTSSCVALEAAVLVLDRDHVVVADRVQRGDEPPPVDLAEAGQPRHLPADAAREGAVAVEAVAPDLEILRVRVEDAVGEVVDGALVVDLQPDEVRRVDVEPEVRVGDRREHLVPDRRRPGEVVAARPLVVAEDHRAVLDRDLHAALAGVGDELRPDLGGSGSRFSGSGRSLSLPTNVPTMPTPSACAASIDLAQVCVHLARGARRRDAGCSGSRRATRSRAPCRSSVACTASASSASTSMCVTPAYRRCSPPEAGQHATSSISKPFAAAHAGDLARASRSANAAVSSPSFTASPPPIVCSRFDSRDRLAEHVLDVTRRGRSGSRSPGPPAATAR